MVVEFGRGICGELAAAETREWLVTNGIGGYASGTIAGLLTRRYHGLLIAALKAPVNRTLLLSKLEETIDYDGGQYALSANRWVGGKIEPQGYHHLERFYLDGTIPVWQYACGDALLEKRVWMQLGENTTYIRYYLDRGSSNFKLSIKALVNYRTHHSETRCGDWQMDINTIEHGISVSAFPEAKTLYLFTNQGIVSPAHDWYRDYDLAQERYRGLADREDHLNAAKFAINLEPGDSITIVASTNPEPNLDGEAALQQRLEYERGLIENWRSVDYLDNKAAPRWVEHLVLAADQFVVDRPLAEQPDGKTIVAGYPWFSDWGRDTMISLSGLTVSAGRPKLAKNIIATSARFLDQGMLPNVFPDETDVPGYNTVDATLWYFEAIRAYFAATQDFEFIKDLYPKLVEVIDWHVRGTRYKICLDPTDGLLYAGEAGMQLTWMDAKIGDWVVTPRIGKPIEVNALWYNALLIMVAIAKVLDQPYATYEKMAIKAATGFNRFWNPALGYCFDVLDTPTGDDDSLRPNQILAVALPHPDLDLDNNHKLHPVPLLNISQQQKVVETCARRLLTSHGLRSLSPDHRQYQGHYGGDQVLRDCAYHQGTVWGWLIGSFIQAHLRVYKEPAQAHRILAAIASNLNTHGVGSMSEIFDGNAPMYPRGCVAQAWTVAEVLRAWLLIEHDRLQGS
ncbi:glycogen debranching enzyme [Thalassoporum mexicanum PCC 7367]|uniref:amylo-alpha-1,6-glucosidase n=1 Tax=Thalassoporum mexicanum TaxID=3457544 RepID=UPI00029F9E1E|nr:amylo-alpha-1,6-glucosidase [Pseudanabaena sp. PCC 7367]AFY68856.1 glycogen debranching enzyme [Pseudanabaena sp. PCC 7367]